MVKHKKDVSQAEEASHRKVPCRCCASLPYQGQRMIEAALGGDVQFDFESGMYELIMRMNVAEDEIRLDTDAAVRIADRTSRYQTRLQTQFSEYGFLDASKQRDRIRPLAPFDLDELKLGAILGTGGFSSVVEVERFEKRVGSDDGLRPHQVAAREFVTQHAQRVVDDSVIKSVQQHAKRGETTSRFAIKFLRKGLMQEPDRFERAAIDLVLETQLLLAMDHPNILAIRGLSREGPAGYRHGKYISYFLILDRLPENLNDRIWDWRNRLRRYKSRSGLPWGKRKYTDKKDDLLRERMVSCLDMARALEYMHSLRIINRDFKSGNVGYDIFGELKVFDFGLSRLLPPEEERINRGFVMSRVGTKYYMAPEVADKSPYDLSADVYSYGVVLWEVLALASPREAFKKCQHMIPDDEMCPLPLCTCWSDTLREVVRACLSYIPEDRPTMRDVCEALQGLLEDLGVSSNTSEDGSPIRRRSTVRFSADEFKTEVDADGSTDPSDTMTAQIGSSYDRGLPCSESAPQPM